MKTHITNVYGADSSIEYISKTKSLASVGHDLGFFERAIYLYNVDSDSESELDKRIDGIIAGIEKGDLVFYQLPTGNGELFDRKLSEKFKIYGANIIYILHELPHYTDFSFFNNGDTILTSNGLIQNTLITHGLKYRNILTYSLCDDETEYYAKQKLLELSASYISLNPSHNNALSSKHDSVVHVCFGLQDRSGYYSSFVGATIASVSTWSTRKICFHIIIDNSVSEQNKRYLSEVAIRYGNMVSFHLINPETLMNDNPSMSMYSIGSLFRLLIPKSFPEMEKMIYLDADLMFYKKDIGELWDIDLSYKALAAVIDEGLQKGYYALAVSSGEVARADYFNSGLLVLNLNIIRAMGDLDVMVMNYINTHSGTDLPDQDGLNCIFAKNILKLDSSWNTFVRFERTRTDELTPKVYHYVGMRYVTFAHLTEYDKLYLRIRKDLPWGSDRVIEDLEYGLVCAYNHVNALQKFVTVTSGQRKKWIFYGYDISGMPAICNMLQLKETDYFIKSDPNDKNIIQHGLKVYPFEKLTEETKGDFVVLVLPEAGLGNGIENLKSIGLEPDKDFFIIPTLLTSLQGGYI